MMPSAEPTAQRAEVAAHLVPANLLADGEIVILAIKPSSWFVLIASLPVLAGAAAVAAAAGIVDHYRPGTPDQLVYSFAATAAVARLAFGCWQWLGRTYVLTNLRVITVRGLINVGVTAAALSEVREAVLGQATPERVLGLGSIYCLADSEAKAAVSWSTIANPLQVQEILDEAIRRARRTNAAKRQG